MNKKYLKILALIILLGVGFVYVNKKQKLGATLTEVEPEVKTQIGYFAIHQFRNNTTGELIEVPTTKEEYDKLALPNPINPTMNGYTWESSWAGPIFATSSTVLLDNQFARAGKDVASSSIVRVKLPNESEKIIKESDLPR